MDLKTDELVQNALIWTQYEDMLVVVDRFNIVSFYSCLTGRVIFKEVLANQINGLQNFKRFQTVKPSWDLFEENTALVIDRGSEYTNNRLEPGAMSVLDL